MRKHFYNNKSMKRIKIDEKTSAVSKLLEISDFFGQAIKWEDTGIVFIQHFLPSIIDIPKALIQLGIPSQNIVGLKKPYSECKDVTLELENLGIEIIQNSKPLSHGSFNVAFNRDIMTAWNKAINKFKKNNVKKIIIIDDGFYLTPSFPMEELNLPVIAIEQTTSGIIPFETKNLPFPVILFAGSATKKFLETTIIVREIEKSINSHLKLNISKNSLCGILGNGTIGKALASYLNEQGHKVMVYDKDPNKIPKTNGNIFGAKNLHTLTASVDYLFSMTGNDATIDMNPFEETTKNIVAVNFGSASEFRTLLQHIHHQVKNNKNTEQNTDFYHLRDLEYATKFGSAITVKNSGFVGNFNKKDELSTKEDIFITRASIFACIIQAANYLNKKDVVSCGKRYMLDPRLQSKIATQWINEHINQSDIYKYSKNFKNLSWIVKNSCGINPRQI